MANILSPLYYKLYSCDVFFQKLTTVWTTDVTIADSVSILSEDTTANALTTLTELSVNGVRKLTCECCLFIVILL